MVKLVLCEDEESQRKLVRGYLEDIFEKQGIDYELKEYESSKQLLENYSIGEDIILLDIHTQDSNGMEAAREIRKLDKNVSIIFITGVTSYLQEGYEVRAYRYLLKPIKYDVLEGSILQCLNEMKDKEYIAINENGNLRKIYLDQLLYIEVNKRNIVIKLNKCTYEVKGTLSTFEEKLQDKNFYKCHKSYLINLDKVDCINKSFVTIGEQDVPVSKHRLKELKLEMTKRLGELL